MANDLKLIAFYLPQFHPIPENDKWWGKGFTEWANVKKAKPLFPGHYQPHVPADLGYYDLRCPETRQAQADLAREYGIYGFCYFHYWFSGKQLLEKPFNEVLESGKPDFPFCLCWDNNSWTRDWAGDPRQVLMSIKYNSDDDLAHFQSLTPAFKDKRYIRIDGKPLFILYHAEDLPNPKLTTAIWREEAKRSGIGEIYLARVEIDYENRDPRDFGFDAGIEQVPITYFNQPKCYNKSSYFLATGKFMPKAFAENNVHLYPQLIDRVLRRQEPNYPYFRNVMPSWDNSPRRVGFAADIYLNSSPERYENWLKAIITMTRKKPTEERIIFINAWNEWGEGNHLEPDLRWGRAYLESTKRALNSREQILSFTRSVKVNNEDKTIKYLNIKMLYWELVRRIRGYFKNLETLKKELKILKNEFWQGW